MDDKSIICNFENLYNAYKRAKAGKRRNESCARFQTMSLDGVHILLEQLKNKTYKMNPYNEFKVYEPKERLIRSCSFKDKVVQHCLSDTILHPRLENQFIKTNYAGQKNKGTLFGMDCLKKQMLEFYQKHKLDGWILRCDVTKFFYSIDHEILKDIVDYYFPDNYIMWLNHLLIDSTDGIGVPLGNQVAQIYALLMLDGLDHMVTGELGINLYGRYMDDFYLIHHDKKYLKWCLDCINQFVESLGLTSVQKDNLLLENIIQKPRGFNNGGVHEICTPITSSGWQENNFLHNQYRIRKLTPKECWRLMDFSDEDFEKAEKVNSNTQLYKQAGNSIVVNVLVAILGQLLQGKEDLYKEISINNSALGNWCGERK